MTMDTSKSLAADSASHQESEVWSTPGLLARLVEAATAASVGDREYGRRTLEKALALLTASRESLQLNRSVPPRGGLAPWQAKRIAAYVTEHIGAAFRARELATLVRLSYSHFNRAFKASFHETPTGYIARQRVRAAQEKMLSTAHPLSRVALECGLCDQAHFSRMFRRVVGQSPRLWRRQYASDMAAPMGVAKAAH